MKKLAVVANCRKTRAPEVLARLARRAEELGLGLAADRDTARLLKCRKSLPLNRLFKNVDAVMALGGDGTMLSVARAMDGAPKPVIGVNLGGLGFLTSVAESDLERALECLAADKVRIKPRCVEEVSVIRNQRTVSRHRALNEVVIARGRSLRVVTLDVFINKDKGTSYVCDGLIISTPTGSTGHSLSSGGPIVSPDTRAFVISLICPHTLSSRPLVVPDSAEIMVRLASSAGDIQVTVDGQVHESLRAGDAVRVVRSPKDALFVHLPGYSYFAVLRQKLHWRGKNV